jgi:hypothetical protein
VRTDSETSPATLFFGPFSHEHASSTLHARCPAVPLHAHRDVPGIRDRAVGRSNCSRRPNSPAAQTGARCKYGMHTRSWGTSIGICRQVSDQTTGESAWSKQTITVQRVSSVFLARLLSCHSSLLAVFSWSRDRVRWCQRESLPRPLSGCAQNWWLYRSAECEHDVDR